MSKPLSKVTIDDYLALGDGDHDPHQVSVMRVTGITSTAFIVETKDGDKIRYNRDTGQQIGADSPTAPVRAASGRDMFDAARADGLRIMDRLREQFDSSADDFDQETAFKEFDALALAMNSTAYAHFTAATRPRNREEARA